MLVVPAYLLPVSGADLIIGSSWLATLGPHIADYTTSTLKFFQHDKFIVLQGENNTGPQQAHFHHVQRLERTQAIAECFTIQLVQAPQVDPPVQFFESLQLELSNLLQKYVQFFKNQLACLHHEHRTMPFLCKQAQNLSRLDHTAILTVRRHRLKPWFKRCCNKVLYNLVLALSLHQFYWLKRKMEAGVFVPTIVL